MNEVQTVKSETAMFTELRRRLTELHPDLDDQTLADTLEGATNLQEALAALIRSALEDEALAKGLRTLIEAMKERLSRLEARATSKRITALDSMKAANIPKFIEPDFTASLRTAPPSLVVLCDTEIPSQFLIPQPPKLDRRSLLQALVGGADIPGLSLGFILHTLREDIVMGFSTPQIRKLRTNVRPQFIKERQLDGKVLPYVEAWHVIAEANRVFGHDGWDRETISTQCIWQKQADGRFGAAYVARVRITVRADGINVVREGFGAGEALSPTPGQAHEGR